MEIVNIVLITFLQLLTCYFWMVNCFPEMKKKLSCEFPSHRSVNWTSKINLQVGNA